MRVTVKFDEAAAMLPSEVKVQQSESERAREANRKWACAERYYVARAEWRAVSIGAAMEAAKGVRL